MMIVPWDYRTVTRSRGNWGAKRDDHHIYRKRARRRKVKAARKASLRRARS